MYGAVEGLELGIFELGISDSGFRISLRNLKVTSSPRNCHSGSANKCEPYDFAVNGEGASVSVLVLGNLDTFKLRVGIWQGSSLVTRFMIPSQAMHLMLSTFGTWSMQYLQTQSVSHSWAYCETMPCEHKQIDMIDICCALREANFNDNSQAEEHVVHSLGVNTI